MAPSAVSLLAVAVALLGVLQPAATSPPPSPPAAPATGPPVSCASTLYNLFSCTPFLSTGTPLAGPPASCCATLRATLASPDSICLCHLIDGWFNQFANVNIDAVRLALLPIVCLAIVPPELPYVCSEGPVPPIIIVPPGPQATRDSVASTAPPATLPRAALRDSVASTVPPAPPAATLPRAALKDSVARRG